MRILMISLHPYFPQQVGGREWVMHETACLMAKDGHQVFVMSGLAPHGPLYVRNRIFSALARQAYPRDTLMSYPVHRGWPLEVGLPQVAKRVKPDVAIIEGGGDAVVIAKQLRALRIPAVIRLHDSSLHQLGGRPQDIAGTPFITVSRFLAEFFGRTFDESAIVIPPLINPDRCTTESTRTRVVFINPRPIKGGEIAVGLAERCPHIQFRFFEAWAKDEEVKVLEARAKALPNVEWRASVLDPREIYRDAHCVLIPSRGNETWGRVATEAHFSGVPAIATDRGGLPEAVGPGGVLIDPDAGVDAWQEALSALWQDTNRYGKLSQQAAAFSQRSDISPDFIMAQTYKAIGRATILN